MKLPFHTLDVFTERALEGNPLAVVLDADGLDPARMQSVAREFNLSETVFVLSPRDPVNSARIRIFTPARELPFAGHPTVGTAVLLASLRAPGLMVRQDLALVIEEEIGLVRCIARKPKGIARASFTLPQLPAAQDNAVPPAEALAAALGLAADDVGFEGHAPSRYSAGVPFVFVPLRDLDAMARAKPDPAQWDKVLGPAPAYLYTRATVLGGHQFHARMFAPRSGISEDPATGSAVAAFAGAIMAHDSPGDGDHTILVEQGFEMGRPSLITLGLEVQNQRLVSASIGGSAVVVSQGTLDL